MQFKNPLFLYVITIILFCLLLSLIIYINSIRSAGAISLKQENNVVTIVAEDLKVPFFGTAFHINFDPQKYTYDHFTLGDYFEIQDDPLVLVNPVISKNSSPKNSLNGEIIVGISLKRGQIITKTEGTLLKLYFKEISNKNIFNNFTDDKIPSNEFSFSNAVFSTFDKKKGERSNIKNIKFIDLNI